MSHKRFMGEIHRNGMPGRCFVELGQKQALLSRHYLRSYAVRKYGMREGDSAQFNAFRNYIGCHLGFMRLYQAIIQDDDKRAANELIASFVV